MMIVGRFWSDRTDDVHSLHGKGPWSRHGMQVPWRCMDLTLTALFYEIDAIVLYGEPEVTCLHYLLSEHETVHMWTANSPMYFLH